MIVNESHLPETKIKEIIKIGIIGPTHRLKKNEASSKQYLDLIVIATIIRGQLQR